MKTKHISMHYDDYYILTIVISAILIGILVFSKFIVYKVSNDEYHKDMIAKRNAVFEAGIIKFKDEHFKQMTPVIFKDNSIQIDSHSAASYNLIPMVYR